MIDLDKNKKLSIIKELRKRKQFKTVLQKLNQTSSHYKLKLKLAMKLSTITGKKSIELKKNSVKLRMKRSSHWLLKN
jgi:hypothetical protein